MADPMARRLAGRYEVRSLIGRGGMAEVHLGFDTRLSRHVAIKMLRTDLARDSIFQARFRREAQSAASLNHPNIVAVYDTGEEFTTMPDGSGVSVPYIVMEYIEGHTVKELLSDGTPVPINEAVSIVSGVLNALEYSHSQHLVHRDIKPGNVMLTNDGKVKVMDFGIARALTDSQATMTQTNAVLGTAQYLSPEQARGEQVDARSDLYSTGVVLFELLTGRPPFTGDSAVAVAYQHVQQLAPTPSSVTPDIPEALDRVVMKALAKNREDRYSSAGSMLADLMRAVGSGRVNAPATAVWAETIPPTDTQTQMLTPGAQTQTMASVPGFHPVGADAVATMPQAVEPPRRSGKKIGIIAALIIVSLALIGGIWFALMNSSKSPETIAVPDNLVNMTEAEAKAAVEGVGLKFAVSQDQVASATIEEGRVAEVDPASGTTVEIGTTVTAKLSSGPDSVQIPSDLIGMTPDEARAAVEAVGLKWEQAKDEVASDTVEKGKIAQVNPSAGTKVKKGAKVVGSVSSGSKQVQVPDIIGMTQDQAREALAAKNLTVGSVETVDDPSQTAGHVVSSTPGVGETANKGDTVTITLASGKVVIPGSLVGYEQSSVVAALEALTLSVTVEQQYSDTVAADAVISVDPGEGSTVAQGAKVKVVVSQGKKPAAPPANGGGAANGGGSH